MLTEKQHDLFIFIDDYIKKNGFAPSFDEMRMAVGLKSKSGIHSLVQNLIDRGFIEQLPNRARAMEIKKYPSDLKSFTKQEKSTGTNSISAVMENFKKLSADDYKRISPLAGDIVNIPVFGKIAAGTPIEAIKDTGESKIPVSSYMLGKGTFYALKVEGDSMIEAGIHDGDFVVIKETDHANDGAIVVALVDDEQVTLKYLQTKPNEVALIPANQRYQTKTFEPGRVKIQGELAMLIRNY